jgi:hypothetical protein
MSSSWRKSSYSNQTGGACIEVATADAVLIRDTTDHGHGPVLRVSAETWRAFTHSIRMHAGLS